jgi:hypothetical protein
MELPVDYSTGTIILSEQSEIKNVLFSKIIPNQRIHLVEFLF